MSKIDPQKPITLNLTIAKIDKILTALGSLPYSQVSGLIGEIQVQAAKQLSPPKVETPSA